MWPNNQNLDNFRAWKATILTKKIDISWQMKEKRKKEIVLGVTCWLRLLRRDPDWPVRWRGRRAGRRGTTWCCGIRRTRSRRRCTAETRPGRPVPTRTLPLPIPLQSNQIVNHMNQIDRVNEMSIRMNDLFILNHLNSIKSITVSK